MQKGVSTLVGIIIIVAVAVVLFGGVFAWQYLTIKSQQNSQFFGSSQKTNQTQNRTAGWKTYKNDEYGFEFQYPTDKFFDYNKNGIDSRCSAGSTNVPCKYLIGNPDITKSINKMRVVIIPDSILDKYFNSLSVSKKVNIGNRQGYTMGYSGSKFDPPFSNKVYYLQLGNNILEIDFTYDTTTKLKGDANIELPFAEDLIINSFKFIK